MATGLRVVKRYTLHNPTYGAGVTVPAGWGAAWRAFRDGGSLTSRREAVFFGDSTTWGSGGLYSYVQRLRDRAVAYGCTDGGKGMFGGGESQISYDAPEVNGWVSQTFTGSTDSYDTLAGQYWMGSVAGETLVLRFRTSSARLWYVDRPVDGDFTYSVDGAAPTTVAASARTSGNPLDKFVWLTGYTPGVTHTLTITNLGSRSGDTSKTTVRIALAPVNDVGVAFQKQATSGGTISAFFHGSTTPVTGGQSATRYQAPLGLVPTAPGPTSADGYATGNTVDTGYTTAARVKPILAMFDLAFNDLSNQTSTTDYSLFTEGVRKFAAACRTTGCDGIVSAGNSPVNASWPTYGVGMYNAMKAQAATEGLAWADMWQPFGGALAYSGGTANPHLTKAQYVQQADFLWDNLLGV